MSDIALAVMELSEEFCDKFCKYSNTGDADNGCEWCQAHDNHCPFDNILKEVGANRSCKDCEEYDHEHHNCPKFCNTIRETMNDRVVEELKNIKAEINEFCKDYLCTPQPEVLANEINIYIIDKHIEELKEGAE